jgi:hypothetical protein
MKIRKRLKPYLPNHSDRFALVTVDQPIRAWWRARIWQIVGGRTWSLSIIRLAPEPELVARPTHQD